MARVQSTHDLSQELAHLHFGKTVRGCSRLRHSTRSTSIVDRIAERTTRGVLYHNVTLLLFEFGLVVYYRGNVARTGCGQCLLELDLGLAHLASLTRGIVQQRWWYLWWWEKDPDHEL